MSAANAAGLSDLRLKPTESGGKTRNRKDFSSAIRLFFAHGGVGEPGKRSGWGFVAAVYFFVFGRDFPDGVD